MPANTSHPKAGMLRRAVYPILPVLAIFAAFSRIAAAQQVIDNSTGPPQSINFTLGKVFTFLFLTLGPLKLLAPFHAMTRSCNAAQRKSLAYKSTIIALIAIILASISGANILHKWGISIGALLLTAGLVLFLVALKPILEQFAHINPQAVPQPSADAPPPSAMQLAFPTIVTPYGIAILIVLVSLRSSQASFLQILETGLPFPLD